MVLLAKNYRYIDFSEPKTDLLSFIFLAGPGSGRPAPGPGAGLDREKPKKTKKKNILAGPAGWPGLRNFRFTGPIKHF